jgi:hypothetical protein
MLEWAWCSFHKKRDGTRYAELVFLHPVGSAGYVVHSSVSGARCGFHKKRDGTRYTELVFLHAMGYVGHVVHSGVFGP